MKEVKNENQAYLREQGLMSQNEVAYIQGDLIVVVDVTNENRRVLGSAASFLNENVEKRILKG